MSRKMVVAASACPFCGSANGFVEREEICVYRYWCDCGARGPAVEKLKYEDGRGEPENDAVKAWNKRRRTGGERGLQQHLSNLTKAVEAALERADVGRIMSPDLRGDSIGPAIGFSTARKRRLIRAVCRARRALGEVSAIEALAPDLGGRR
jgi:hypothetical protein